LNHCKEMGAEPGRRSLKMPAEKLGPVIVVPDLNYGDNSYIFHLLLIWR